MDRYLEFAGNHPFLLLALTVSFFLLVFSELRRKASGLINIEASEAVKLINNDAAVIDLRSADAHGRGHIVNAKSVPFDELPAKMETLAKNKDKPLIAVCDAGITSNKAIKTLREAGFASAYGLKGGMAAWTQEGLPVVTGKKTKSKKKK
ncbi:MAG: rhodanese-like domain-containing protein [Woeseiaceae bacterium]|nr:rhodanese-like domain-containing protein [Woeseiaceae bacterium]